MKLQSRLCSSSSIWMVLGVSALAIIVLCGDAFALDSATLNRAITDSSTSLKELVRTCVKFGGFLSMIVSLAIVGWKLANKDQSSIWHLCCVAAAGALFAVAGSL